MVGGGKYSSATRTIDAVSAEMDKVFDASCGEVFGCCELFRFFEEKRKSDVYFDGGWYLDYRATDQTKELTQPITVQPKKRFSKKIANLFLCCLKRAIKLGKK